MQAHRPIFDLQQSDVFARSVVVVTQALQLLHFRQGLFFCSVLMMGPNHFHMPFWFGRTCPNKILSIKDTSLTSWTFWTCFLSIKLVQVKNTQPHLRSFNALFPFGCQWPPDGVSDLPPSYITSRGVQDPDGAGVMQQGVTCFYTLFPRFSLFSLFYRIFWFKLTSTADHNMTFYFKFQVVYGQNLFLSWFSCAHAFTLCSEQFVCFPLLFFLLQFQLCF